MIRSVRSVCAGVALLVSGSVAFAQAPIVQAGNPMPGSSAPAMPAAAPMPPPVNSAPAMTPAAPAPTPSPMMNDGVVPPPPPPVHHAAHHAKHTVAKKAHKPGKHKHAHSGKHHHKKKHPPVVAQ